MLKFKDNNQFKSFMKKESKRLGINIHNTYSTYMARILLERISNYNPSEFLIKGSSAEVAYLGHMIRAIVDLDIATFDTFEENKDSIENILKYRENEQFNFSLNKDIYQTNTGIYKIHLSGNYDIIKQPIGIDYQDKYSRLIEFEKRVMPPIFEGDTPFEIYLPSFEEFLAEKLCIIAENDKEFNLNTRVKDFYDIYELHGGKYDYDKLTHYFKLMLELRGKINIGDIKTTTFNDEYISKRQELWNSAQKKYDFIDKDIDFEGAVYYTRAVLRSELQRNGNIMEENKSLTKR